MADRNGKKSSILDNRFGKTLPPLDAKNNSFGYGNSRKNLLDDFVLRSPRLVSTPTQHVQKSPAYTDDTMISLNGFDMGEIEELAQIDISTLNRVSKADREQMLNDRLKEIENFDGSIESQKNYMKELYKDLEYVLNQNDCLSKVVVKMIEERKKVNEAIKTVNSVVKSVDNFNKRASRIDSEITDMNKRLNSAETVIESSYNSSRLGIIVLDKSEILDKSESEEIESGIVKPFVKVHQIFNYMNVSYAKSSIVNAFLITSRRMINGTSRVVKLLEIKFNDNVTAGRIFAHISKWNNEADKSGSNSVRYFAERPLGPKMLDLFKKSKVLVENKKILKAIPTEKGIKIKFSEVNHDGIVSEGTMFATCESDLHKFDYSDDLPTPIDNKNKNPEIQNVPSSNKRRQPSERISGSKKLK
ncbi:hypothetical protein PVAND_005138 [Polypedilum vanderplanki]|uniref:Uncharacterized protein n=1 Tax=Polypedilum vanderplanki TaxID=319348 RepID=A0A9J6C158_POLVA|nr:hypothetical protein PVAND_005138 [Polypedilum vanderplanki]